MRVRSRDIQAYTPPPVKKSVTVVECTVEYNSYRGGVHHSRDFAINVGVEATVLKQLKYSPQSQPPTHSPRKSSARSNVES